MALEPITRAEQIMSGESLEPITREEMFLAKAAGMDVETPAPITRREMFLSKISGGGSGGGTSEEWIGDGDTHIWITLYEGRTTICLTWTTGGTATVDWGDGTEPEVVASAGAYSTTKTQEHKYDKPGDYVIRISGAELQFVGDRNSSVSTLVLSGRNVSYTNNSNYGCRNRVKKIEVGNSTTIDVFAFAGLDSVGEVFIQSCKETIGTNAFDNCHSLTRITFPGNVKTLGGYMCMGCYSMRYLDFTRCETVPTLSATTALSTIPADCEIRVPAALYDEWIAATNWSTYASKIVAV